MEAHQIVSQIHSAYPKLIGKLARATATTEEWWRSHHREPKTRNPSQSGNVSPVTHYIDYCNQHEAVEPGSGRMLNNRVFASLNAEFDISDDLCPVELSDAIHDEGNDVQKWLSKFRMKDASPQELLNFENQIAENIDALQDALGLSRSLRRQKESQKVTAIGGRG